MSKMSGEDIFNELKYLLRKVKCKKNIEIRMSNLRNTNILIKTDARTSLEISENKILDNNFKVKSKLTTKELTGLKRNYRNLSLK